MWDKLLPTWEQLERWLLVIGGYIKGFMDGVAKGKETQARDDVERLARATRAAGDMRRKPHADKLRYLKERGLLRIRGQQGDGE